MVYEGSFAVGTLFRCQGGARLISGNAAEPCGILARFCMVFQKN